MRKLLITFLLLAPIIGRAQLSSSALTNLVNALFPDNVTGAITPSDLRNGMNAVVLSAPNFIDGGVTATEFSYGASVISDIQTQLGARELLANKNQPNGYVGLDSNGDLSLTAIPNPNHAYGTAALSGGTYTSTDAYPPYTSGAATYPPRYAVSLRCTSFNTGGELLKVGTGPAKAITLASGLAVPSGDLNPNGVHEFVFNGNGDVWVLINPASMGAFSAAFSLSTNQSVITVDLTDGGVALSKMANLAPNKVVGRDTGTGVPTALSVGSALTTSGGTLDVPSGAITLAKQANLANGVIVGRATTGTGVPEAVVIGTGLTLASPGGVPTLTAAGSVSVAVWTPPDPRQWGAYSATDFMTATAAVDGWSSTLTGTGSSSTSGLPGEEGHPGIVLMATGTTATGCSCISKAVNSSLIGPNSTNVVEWCFQLPLASDGTETFIMDAGFGDVATTSADTDAVLVRYSSSLNSGNLVMHLMSNGAQTQTNTAIAMPAATWVKIRIEAQPSLVRSWMYTTATTNALPDMTTGIPSGVGRNLSPIARITKTVGTTSRIFYLDYVQTWIGYTTPIR